MTPSSLPDLSTILGQMKFPTHAPMVILRRPPFTPSDEQTMEALSQRTKLPYFNMTAALRSEVRAKSMVGLAVLQCEQQRVDPPTELVICVAAFQLALPRFSQGAILDELPVTLEEAGLLAQFLSVKALVELGAPDEHLVARAKERRQCMICKRTFPWRRKPAERPYKCLCGGLVPTLDSRKPPEETVAGYRQDTTALADFYKPRNAPHVVVSAGNEVDDDGLVAALETAIAGLPPIADASADSEPQTVA